MSQDEQVLVIERSVLDEIGSFQGITFDIERYLAAFFAAGVARFMPREPAENDPNFKQLIPYVILMHGGNCVSYVRGKRGGESRLVGQRSIGIGGHINPVDESPLFTGDPRETYQAAVEREVGEEVAVDTDYSDRIIALLNDDSTEVGKVHLGIVHLWTLAAPIVNKREQMITQLGFMSPDELRMQRDSLESWSALCLDNLTEICRRDRALAREEALY